MDAAAALIAVMALQTIVLVALVRLADLNENEPLAVVALLCAWGATGALAIAVVLDELVVDRLSARLDAVFGPTLSAPPVEEAAKGLALALVFLGSAALGRRRGWYEFQGVTDGLVYGAAVGLGFAFGENLYYLAELTNSLGGERAVDIVWERVGVLGTGALGHALYTAVFGAALGATVWVRGPAAKAAVAFGGFVAATALHAVHNGGVEALLVLRHGWGDVAEWRATGAVPQAVADRLAGDEASLSDGLAVVEAGLVAACVAAGAAWLWAERRALRRHLAAEAAAGTITAEEAAAIPAFRRRCGRYARLLGDRDLAGYRRRRRLDGAIVELGLRRWRERGGEDGTALDRCRARVDGARRSGSCVADEAHG